MAEKIPLRYLIFTLKRTQREALLREVFTGIYQDEDHPNPSQAYNMLKSYISYYNFSNDVLESK